MMQTLTWARLYRGISVVDMYELGGMSQVRARDLMMYCIVTPKVDVLHPDPILFLLDLCLHVQYI